MVAAAPLIELQSLSVRFGRQTVLRDIDLDVPRGQTLAIIGESGCGKTVLLKTIIGLMQPTRGRRRVRRPADRQADRPASCPQQRTRFGFVFQNAALFDSMTIAENILFPLQAASPASNDADHERSMRSLLSEVGLPETRAAKDPAELSGGMRKRVGLARAWPCVPRWCSTTSRPPASTRS